METAVRSTSMGVLCGTFPRNSTTSLGIGPVANQLGFQRVQLGLLRQLAVPKQVDHFLKLGVVGQSVDVKPW